MAAQTIETTLRSYARSVIQEYTAYAKLLIVMEYIRRITHEPSPVPAAASNRNTRPVIELTDLLAPEL